MLRISGTTWYEEPHFHELCDELALVWQDLALANVDPRPLTPAYLELLRQEVEANLPNGPSLAVVCGSSETEQQATMVGLGPDVLDTLPMRTPRTRVGRRNPPGRPLRAQHTHRRPPALQRRHRHRPLLRRGRVHLRPLTDARHVRATFAAESLAFANVPRPANVRGL